MRQDCCPAPLDGPDKTADYLAYFGFKRSKGSSQLFTFGLPILFFLVFSLFIIALWKYDTSPNKIATGFTTGLLSPLVTFGLLLGTLWQWQTARREMSMDKYYDRLNLANQWWKSSPSVQKIMSAFSADSEDPDMTMYTCLEIDNLEYVVEKYKIGYIDDDQACRALHAFQIRCLAAPEFRQIARRRIHAGDYTSRTATVVCCVCDVIDRMAEHQRASLFVSGQRPEDRPNIFVAAAAINFPGGSPPPPSHGGSRSGFADEETGPRRRASDVIQFASATSSSGSAASGASHPVPRRRASDVSHLSSVPRPDAGSSCEEESHREEGGAGSPSAAGGNL